MAIITNARPRAALTGLLKSPVFGLAWIILDSGAAVGYIVLCFGYSLEYLGRNAFVDEFYLIELHRGRGWGRKALEFACRQARLHHVRAIHLEVVAAIPQRWSSIANSGSKITGTT